VVMTCAAIEMHVPGANAALQLPCSHRLLSGVAAMPTELRECREGGRPQVAFDELNR
jgi:hypothetical protein